ncbi:GNAT family N-acetyltransferase [Peribacillus simplex]|uniref:GNAT family N-acetyltransferase n=1 Tax=Peribacillus simplex TaxID=1478 RepID=UPI0025A2ACAD|nr:GNAT family N-acetyltransferase [Peribacillus simplex]MDM5291764.1 GNAT family N-acetyltransferase [Peribacillus simplex]
MIEFQPITHEQIELLKEIVNSNHQFNTLSEGHPELTDKEILKMYESSENQGTVMNLIMDGDRPVGVIDYLMENPSDKMPWLGLLMIHRDFQGQGYAVKALKEYEYLMQDQGKKRVRLGVIKGNDRALNFWTNRGFTFYEEKQGDKWTVLCFEKTL